MDASPFRPPAALMESSEDTGETYQNVLLAREAEELEAMSLPGPKDRGDVFLLVGAAKELLTLFR